MVIHQNSKTNNQEKAVTLGTFGALLATTLVSGGVIASIPASADDSTKSSSVSVTVSSACTISSDNASGINKTIEPGIRDDALGTTTMKVLCNNPEGYDVYAVGYTNDEWKNTQMIGIDDSNYFDTRDRGDGTYTDTSHWYMKLAPSNSTTEAATITTSPTNFTNFVAIPDDYKLVATHNANTQNTTDASFTVTYGAYITSAQLADTYTGQVKYTVVNPHGTDAKIPNLSDLTYMQEFASLTEEEKTSLIANTPTDTQYQLKDKRDGKTYWVAKLKDGNIWMTQNLDLDLSTSTALTSKDTDLNVYGSEAYTASTGYSCSGSAVDCSDGIIAWTPIRNTIDYTSDAETALGAIPGWENNNDTPYSVDTGDWYWSGGPYSSSLCFVDNNDQTCNYATKSSDTYSAYFSTTPYTTNNTHGHVGNHYNWPAAIATNNSGSYTASTYDDTFANPSNSICPAGWRLPKAGDPTKTTSDFDKLNTQYNSGATDTDAGLIAAPLFFTRSGNVWTSALHNAGDNGLYWSSTVETYPRARYLLFNSNFIFPSNQNYRLDGRSIRCIAK